MDIWFTSDTHYGHRNIIDYCNRPFTDVDEMNEALLTWHNELVAPGDLVWDLGDVRMGRRELSEAYIGRRHGTQRLVAGNHDPCFAGARRRQAGIRRFLDAGFDSIDDTATVAVAGRQVLLCHFPYAGDSHHADRYAEFRPHDRGQWLLHGHVHDAWRQRGRQVNVGVDAWAMRPVHIDQVAALIAAGPAELATLATTPARV